MEDRDHPERPATVATPNRVLALDLGTLAAEIAGVDASRLVHGRSVDLDRAMLDDAMPDLVLFPLFSSGNDAISTVEVLAVLGYTGEIIVVGPPLPNRKMVERELRDLGPGGRLRLLTP